jgi:hypothetical protein
VLPGLLRVAGLLTPTGAVALGIVLVLPFFFHLSRQEPRNAWANVVLVALLAFVVVGRLAISLI